jgi:ribosomal protein L31
LLVVELTESFASEDQAWQSLQDVSSPAHPPRFYTEWVGEQYLTNKTAQVERLEI